MKQRLMVALVACVVGATPGLSDEVAVSSAAVAASNGRQWSFDKDRSVPNALTIARGRWDITTDPSAPSPKRVLAQISVGESTGLLLVKGSTPANVAVQVGARPMTGKKNQSVGIVFRAQNSQNYYLYRVSAIENTAALYKVIDGEATGITYKRVAVPSNLWSTLRVEVTGSDITCYFNGENLFTAQHSLYTEGKVGLWTAADTRAHFDDLTVSPL